MSARGCGALNSLATADTLDLVLEELEGHASDPVADELEYAAAYDDSHGAAAEAVLDDLARMSTHSARGCLESSPVDQGEETVRYYPRKETPSS